MELMEHGPSIWMIFADGDVAMLIYWGGTLSKSENMLLVGEFKVLGISVVFFGWVKKGI